MLQSLSIYNVALIERLDMDFAPGFNVLTGETGAGKSIVIDAVNLVLGERASKDQIKNGADKAKVEAAFADISARVRDTLAQNGIEAEDELILSRELSASGKNTCRINGTLVTLSLLKSIGDSLIDVHGQHEHQALLDPKTHLHYLDLFAGDALLKDKERTAKAARAYHALMAENRVQAMPEAQREREMELLRYQVQEIEAAALAEDEENKLHQERKLLMNAERIMGALSQSYALLNDEGGALPGIRSAQQELAGIAALDESYASLNGKLEELYYALEDAVYTLRDKREEFTFDAQRLEQIEERLEVIAGLKRKYGQDIPAILACAEAARVKLEAMEQAAQRREVFEQERQKCEAAYTQAAKALHTQREKAAKALEKETLLQLAALGMDKARFSVAFHEADVRFAEAGTDEVEFLLSANPGEPLKPLAKVASGGELSRIMLAFKTINADRDDMPTLIFDEIDTGISGKMALCVGEKIVRIAKAHQVLCVTHLPQIAAFADTHFLVEKSTDGKTTKTDVTPLSEAGSIARLADMMGGGADSQLGREHAEELRRLCESEKKNIRK